MGIGEFFTIFSVGIFAFMVVPTFIIWYTNKD